MKDVIIAILLGIILIDLIFIYACFKMEKQDKED